MDIALPLDQMSTEDKLRAMEAIWEDLCRTPGTIPSPAWHEKVLLDRERRLKEGADAFVDWEDAKKSIRDSIP